MEDSNSDESNLPQENEEENTQLPWVSKPRDQERSARKRSRNHGRYLDELIIKELERPVDNKYDHFGKYVASELRSIGNPSVDRA